MSVPVLVDGMNVIGCRPDGWWSNRDRAMRRLVGHLERLAGATGEQLTVVFERPSSPPIRSRTVEVTHAPSPRRNAADEEIVRRLRLQPRPAEMIVVTSDRALAAQARALGAAVEPAAAFRARLDLLA
jgi:predicted RNA-binding protein with PIN domain